ncbi:25S rRNA (uridine(2843)-N(3))-methyltransferase [Tolypocladium ophioglossoides CBS 100239]|uniref:25S rRNA (Uridine(2843)-N(3))-methyltransferase n=1 Tax=Tolypocladium ophioglossoides (strain CBS 100239) TaxID=1163406 RepID=A0A0L0MXM9_TOLOC|nr:25S rRNA (uridine(2843)-N(3))-methyltransferase [Tolypocladium ophioglossoides CBS 100239]
MVGKTTPKRTLAASSNKPSRGAQQQAAAASSTAPTVFQDTKDQQRLLNIFSGAFSRVLSSESFPTLLQEIKQALFNRDFAAAFGREDYLEAYAARWSPTRALCYATVFLGARDYVDQILVLDHGPATTDTVDHDQEQQGQPDESEAQSRSRDSPSSKRLRMLSIGGCAAEHVAFASYIRDTSSQGTLTLLDSAPWSHVAALLQTQLTAAPPLSKYASAAAKAANQPLLLEPQLSLTFSQGDALSLTKDKLAELVGAQPLVVTLLFTLNELYTDGGIGKTTKFVRLLGEVLPQGSLLLVVDSPGSYSEAAVGKEKKRYPMQWLLSHTLLETDTSGYTWERLESQDSIWFRLPEGLSYPIQLENMRYQMHLYKIHKT